MYSASRSHNQIIQLAPRRLCIKKGILYIEVNTCIITESKHSIYRLLLTMDSTRKMTKIVPCFLFKLDQTCFYIYQGSVYRIALVDSYPIYSYKLREFEQISNKEFRQVTIQVGKGLYNRQSFEDLFIQLEKLKNFEDAIEDLKDSIEDIKNTIQHYTRVNSIDVLYRSFRTNNLGRGRLRESLQKQIRQQQYSSNSNYKSILFFYLYL